MLTDSKQSKQTTIYDIAEIAGVSASAVSAVLNGNWKKRRISVRLAEKISRIAVEHDYSINKQASLLRSNKSHIVGMLVPKYDNRYFGSIVEHFERMARDRNLFPVVTCTQRDPKLEEQAAKEMLSYKVGCIISTGASDPDSITRLCNTWGVKSLNLDLPGSLAPSVISDNYAGAKELTRKMLIRSRRERNKIVPMLFIGGSLSDHNTRERIRGFIDAHEEQGLKTEENSIHACGYEPTHAIKVLENIHKQYRNMEVEIFVNSTMSLEGVLRWLNEKGYTDFSRPFISCFDWDPFISLLDNRIEVLKQDVPTMLMHIFKCIESNDIEPSSVIEVPPIINND